MIDIHDAIQSPNLIYETLIKKFLTFIYPTIGTYPCSNEDLCKLSFNDRSILLHSAADNFSCMSGAVAVYQCHLILLDNFSNALETMYGKHIVAFNRLTKKFIDPDIVVIKLGYSLFALSQNTCFYPSTTSQDLTNPINILEIQNKYAEVTWKYLLYKYGHYQAVQRFLKLVS